MVHSALNISEVDLLNLSYQISVAFILKVFFLSRFSDENFQRNFSLKIDVD